ncbi:hypothetical protein D9611_006408 [Ephemerocybe angulata]|uniref:Mitotic-spindle organizing protein 1 n=1 Tax=Ephemerocybe angulata TaxID=980116 RepID=A0A8H5C6K3_9AGAR|nr:hypothetical protein D9611_006408 [Tulosesus angulatus]
MSTKPSEGNASAQQTLDILYEMSQLLNTQLDKETLATCVGLIESGVNPDALAVGTIALYSRAQSLMVRYQEVIQELRREGAARAQPSAE